MPSKLHFFCDDQNEIAPPYGGGAIQACSYVQQRAVDSYLTTWAIARCHLFSRTQQTRSSWKSIQIEDNSWFEFFCLNTAVYFHPLNRPFWIFSIGFPNFLKTFNSFSPLNKFVAFFSQIFSSTKNCLPGFWFAKPQLNDFAGDSPNVTVHVADRKKTNKNLMKTISCLKIWCQMPRITLRTVPSEC